MGRVLNGVGVILRVGGGRSCFVLLEVLSWYVCTDSMDVCMYRQYGWMCGVARA